MKKILLALSLMSFATFAELPKYNSVTEFVQNEVQEQADYVSRHEDDSAEINDSWYLNLIRLRVRGNIGLEIPIFASFEIKPRLELRWKRKTPKGYVDYSIR